ncbi:type II secretion system F family protein [Jezberella montanilacus]|nr:type II secretion system F family protein [Jezberella montanilacus]
MAHVLLVLTLGVSAGLLSLCVMTMATVGFPSDACDQRSANGRLSQAINGLTRRLRPFMTWGQRSYLERKLRRAGLDEWAPEDLFAIQLGLFVVVILALCLALCVSNISLGEIEPLVIAGAGLMAIVLALMTSLSATALWIDNKHKKLSSQIGRALPSFMDLIAISLSAGLNLSASFQFATHALAESQFKLWCRQILRDVETGRALCQVLQDFSKEIDSPALDYFVVCVHQTDTMGTSLARQISDHATQMREERYMQTEKQSMQAPVKMLLPLAVCIFPCNFLVLGFPILSHILNIG